MERNHLIAGWFFCALPFAVPALQTGCNIALSIQYNMKMRGVFVALLLLCAAGLFGQSGRITGIVRDDNGKPIAYATVGVLHTSIGTACDSVGRFFLQSLPVGQYTLRFAAVSFNAVERKVTVSDEPLNLMIRLSVFSTDEDVIVNRSDVLGNVTVTAEKREEKVQAIPAGISVITSKAAEDYRLWNSNQLSSIVPSLYSDNSGDERNVTSLRGIVTTSYDPAVATYIDGVNQFTLDTYIGTLTDVERIEVLRGPQGTLYGRNAMGGVINIITKQPTNKPEAFAEVNLGNYGLQRYTAGFRVPLVKDKLFAGASFLYTQRDGYYTNDFDNRNFDKQHLFYGNYYLKYLPGQHWMITANAKHQENRNNGAFPLVNGLEEAFANPYHLNQNATAKMIDNNFNTSLVVNHSGTALNFTSISSYQNNYRIYNAPLDGDFSPYDVVSIINNYGKEYNNTKVFTQEFRINSANEKQRLKYTAGAYYFYQHSPVKQGTYYGELANAVYGVGDSLFTVVNKSIGKGNGIAFYGQLQYALTPKLNVVAGARYDDEYRKLSVASEYQKGEVSFPSLPDTSASARFHAFSPKLSLQYIVANNSNVYATYTRGFRTGGLSPVSSDPSQPPLYAYSPENSNNFEIGSKNVWLHNKLRVNLTAFTTYVNNAQVPTLVLPDAITVIRNTGKLRTKGIEAELDATPAKGLELTYNLGIVDTKYKSLKLSQNGNEVDLEGRKQIYTPAFTSLLAAQYNFILGKESRLSIRGEWNRKGKTYFDFANTIEQKSYSLFNARAGISTKHFGVFVWAQNIGDKKYIAYAYDFGAVHLGVPRTYGITLNTKL